jgi:hypothetical protein
MKVYTIYDGRVMYLYSSVKQAIDEADKHIMRSMAWWMRKRKEHGYPFQVGDWIIDVAEVNSPFPRKLYFLIPNKKDDESRTED